MTKSKPYKTENYTNVYRNIHTESNFALSYNSTPDSNIMKGMENNTIFEGLLILCGSNSNNPKPGWKEHSHRSLQSH